MERIKYEKYIWCYVCMVNARCVNWFSIRINFNYENKNVKTLVMNLTGVFLFVIIKQSIAIWCDMKKVGSTIYRKG